jgi:hypothetical protein
MKINSIKQLAETCSVDELKKAEEALVNEEELPFEVPGEDEGEQMTHLLGAIWVAEQMMEGVSSRDALRAFSQRVRNSIQ